MDFGNYLTFVFEAQGDLHLYLTFSCKTRFICQARAGAGRWQLPNSPLTPSLAMSSTGTSKKTI